MRLFGTDGIRGVVGQDMTPELALRLGQGLGTHLAPGDEVALGTDARTSAPLLAAAVEAGLLSAGVNVVRLGISPTPAIQYYAARHENVKAAVIVTASHNPPEWNGLKYIHGDGTEAGREDEEHVESLMESRKFRLTDWKKAGAVRVDDTSNASYVKGVLSHLDVAAVRKRALRVVLDPAGGPGALTSPRLLEELGCKTVAIHGELDGAFSGRKSEPVEENLSKLKAKVVEARADLGIAHDGDADRAIFVDEKGEFVPGDQSFALLAGLQLRRAKGGVLCTPVSTSSLVEEIVRREKGRVIYTAVGSPIVARRMRAEKAVFGGEENGGLIFPEHQYCRDALMSAGRMLELLASSGKSLHELRAELPGYHVTKSKFACPNEKKPLLTQALKTWIRKEHPSAKVDETDGIKIYFSDGWVLARPSGTEPIYRVYGESRDAKRSRELAESVVAASQGLLKKL